MVMTSITLKSGEIHLESNLEEGSNYPDYSKLLYQTGGAL